MNQDETRRWRLHEPKELVEVKKPGGLEGGDGLVGGLVELAVPIGLAHQMGHREYASTLNKGCKTGPRVQQK